MDTVVAFKTNTHVAVLMDTSHESNVFVLSRDFDKSRTVLNKHLLIVTGDSGDRCSHGDFLAA